jgi:hypothetical protein
MGGSNIKGMGDHPNKRDMREGNFPLWGVQGLNGEVGISQSGGFPKNISLKYYPGHYNQCHYNPKEHNNIQHRIITRSHTLPLPHSNLHPHFPYFPSFLS